MDKERLEEITSSVGILSSGDRHVLLRRKHYEWLIEQAERVQELEEEIERTDNSFANAYMQYQKQYERVQELEELIAAYHTELSIKNNANKRIKKKNKRYREALEEISQKRITYADMAGVLRIAREALEGEE